tara:strand:- start:1140 stop:2219 length:1080 start_codon:yes stop_codon:yes gene_type:complete
MKIAILNDTHFGARNDSLIFDDYFHKFYDEVFFPYLKEHNIKTLIHLGDIVDRRKYINYRIAHNFRHKFLQKLWDEKIDTHIIIGNHDIYFRNTNKINAVQELCTAPDGLNEPWIYEEPKVVNFDGLNILMLPWINPENEKHSLETLNTAQADVVMAHLDLNGFQMHGGIVQSHGYDKSIVSRFEKVLSGHFHHKSDDGQVFYLGSQYEITWSDYNNKKGFHIFDTATRELEFIPNPNVIFKKILYNDSETNYDKFDVNPYHHKFVKLVVTSKKDNEMFDRLLDKLYNNISVHELKILEDYSDLAHHNVPDSVVEGSEDTMTLVNNYVDQLTVDLDKDKLKGMIKETYVEAQDADPISE